ncbi:MAG TPA: FAD-dependent oxidoreductase, partial [Armatimonadota bacterium]|nr:FAD-dependent oxidoreductase [Armatimonadota bacterium]
VVGGKAYSKIRMHVCGAHGPHMRETGIIEEIRLANAARNPQYVYALWDSVLYGLARFQPNLTLLLNCSANAAAMDGARIAAVTGWQLTTETWHTVKARLFADCSGDSILAPLTGAEFRLGREARAEFGEDIAPDEADRRTMGMTCLVQMRQMDTPQPFIPPSWAYTYLSDDDLPHRGHNMGDTNFWWLELGGEDDAIHDTEELRDELLRIAFGVIDHIKNRGDHGAEHWRVEWVGFLPGKRESRRYVGDHLLTQHDVRAGGPFSDIVAYGGWSMDDHHPAGFRHPGPPTIFHPAPSPYGIPYRCLYSRNIENLFFAGRNISATHAAMSSTRVMATCAILGQAAGTAAAIAARDGLTPRQVSAGRTEALQQMLLDDDCYLPGVARAVSALARAATLAASAGDPEPLRNGVDRPVGAADNGWRCAPGGWVEYRYGAPAALTEARLVFDSDLTEHGLHMPALYYRDAPPLAPPETLVKAFRLEAREGDGRWRVVYATQSNTQRLVRVPLSVTASALRLVPEATWGAPTAHIQAFEAR